MRGLMSQRSALPAVHSSCSRGRRFTCVCHRWHPILSMGRSYTDRSKSLGANGQPHAAVATWGEEVMLGSRWDAAGFLMGAVEVVVIAGVGVLLCD